MSSLSWQRLNEQVLRIVSQLEVVILSLLKYLTFSTPRWVFATSGMVKRKAESTEKFFCFAFRCDILKIVLCVPLHVYEHMYGI